MDRIFGGSYPASNPDDLLSNKPVGSMGGANTGGSLSPYLNFDPKALSGGNESDYLVIEGENHQRGSFERAFSLIGTSMLAGVSWRLLKKSAMMKKKERQNFSILISKLSPKVGKTGITFGIAALQYSILSVFLEKVRGESDFINGGVAGAAVGAFKGLKLGRFTMGKYAAIGLTLGMLLHQRIDIKKTHTETD